MDVLKFSWIKLTPTRALEESCGKLEKAFFESTYRLAYITGLSTSERSTFYSIYSATVKSIIGLFICGELWNLLSQTNSLDGIIDNINVTLIHLIAVYRHISMVSNKGFYKKLAISTQSPYYDILTTNRKKLVDFWVIRNEKYLRLLLILGSCTLSVWYIYPLVDDVEYNLTVALRLPFDYRNPTLYPITYLLVLVAFNYAAFFVIVNDIIMQSHLMNLLCQFTVLADCFENIAIDCSSKNLQPKALILNVKFKKKYVNRFKNLVDQHIFILKNTMVLKKILSLPMLGQLVSSGMLICFAGYQVALTIKLSIAKFLMSLLYLGYNVFELYIFAAGVMKLSYRAESLPLMTFLQKEFQLQINNNPKESTTKYGTTIDAVISENISNAVYFSSWERGVTLMSGVRSSIMLVAARAQKPVVLSAGGMCDLSLATFTTLMKTSYSALTVLLRFQD